MRQSQEARQTSHNHHNHCQPSHPSMSDQSMLARAKTVPHDSLGKSSSGNKLEATEESSRGQQLPALQELSATQDAQEPAPKTQSPPVRPVPPYGDHRVPLLRSPLSLARARAFALSLHPSLSLSLIWGHVSHRRWACGSRWQRAGRVSASTTRR